MGIYGNRLTPIEFKRKHPLELVLFCGSPGSGKSTFYWNNLEPLGYERVNQDILKTVCRSTILLDFSLTVQQRQKCLKVTRELLEAKKSVVVGESSSFGELLDFPSLADNIDQSAVLLDLVARHPSHCTRLHSQSRQHQRKPRNQRTLDSPRKRALCTHTRHSLPLPARTMQAQRHRARCQQDPRTFRSPGLTSQPQQA